MSGSTRQIVLREHPEGLPDAQQHFELRTVPIPTLGDGSLLLQSMYFSVDPYLRGVISKQGAGYMPPMELGTPLVSAAVSRVLESSVPEFVAGDIVAAHVPWQEILLTDSQSVRKVDPSVAPVSTALGILGMPGMTAYFGLLHVGQPKAGETLVVSAAAGAVGSAVGQIGKILGLRVVGIAGSDEKVALLTEKYGFDAVVNYKKPNLEANLRAACPQGVDVYFENVGGEIGDTVFNLMNVKGRVAVCGCISSYNDVQASLGPRLQPAIVAKRLRVQGFLITDFADHYPEARKQLEEWVQTGQLRYDECLVEGFERLPWALVSLFTGDHIGKLNVKVA